MLQDIRPDLTAIAKDGVAHLRHSRHSDEHQSGARDRRKARQRRRALRERKTEIAVSGAGDHVEHAAVYRTRRAARLADVRSQTSGPAQGLMADMRSTLTQAREATADLADNMEAMKRNFLLRGFFNRRGYYDLDSISPEDVPQGGT
jgi:hypothetical protein